VEELEHRDARGTLLCTCGKPGTIFPYSHSKIVNGKPVGVLRGFCNDEHLIIWLRAGMPAWEEVNVEPVSYKEQSLFG
jgi:hypothetical protein